MIKEPAKMIDYIENYLIIATNTTIITINMFDYNIDGVEEYWNLEKTIDIDASKISYLDLD